HHLIIQASAYVADSKAQAVREAGPHLLYFNQTLFSHGNITETSLQRDAGYLSSSSFDYLRPENLPAVSGARERYRDMTMADVEREAEHMPWGTADEVIERITAAAAGPSPELLARGKYVFATAGGCGCHTPPDAVGLNAGGQKFELLIGTIYSRNITPDGESGIGKWTDAQVANAIRRGERPDGS